MSDEISEQPVSKEAEQEEVRIDKISCETIKGAFTSKEDEIAYIQELKTMYDDPTIITNLDEYIETCNRQKELIKAIRETACPGV